MDKNKLLSLFSKNKEELGLTDQHIQNLFAQEITEAALYAYFKMLFKGLHKKPVTKDFHENLLADLKSADLTLNLWLEGFLSLYIWLESNAMFASLQDVKGYVFCVLESMSGRANLLSIGAQTKEMLEEYGFAAATKKS